LAIATIDPVKVIDPTKTEITIEIFSTRSIFKASSELLSGKIATAKATNKEDIPPHPLKRATVSGMAVMATFLATTAPKKVPTIEPAIIHNHELKGIPKSPKDSTKTPTAASIIAIAASRLASRAERTLDKPLMPRAKRKTAKRSIENFRISKKFINKSPYLRVDLRLNIASILSVTRKPPTTLKRANPKETDPITNNGRLSPAFIINVRAAIIVIPEIAFAPLIRGVCKVGGTFPINSKPKRLPSKSTQNASLKKDINLILLNSLIDFDE